MAATKKTNNSYLDKLEMDVKSNQSTLSMVLGALIIIVLGVLFFNYINRNKDAGQTSDVKSDQSADVSPENLPGKYTVKEGDTLYTIADKYYKDGFKYSEIVKANKLDNENVIATGQVIDIPKLEVAVASTAPEASSSSDVVAEANASPAPSDLGTGGDNSTIWGAKIDGDSYTVVEGDWLSTISARAYGDILSYDKIASANNITDPNIITPGMILKLPR
jgi:nucleoid-associated protein YgaU